MKQDLFYKFQDLNFYLWYRCHTKHQLYKQVTMKRSFFKLLAKINKTLLPSYSKRQLDLSKASKLQIAIIGWRVFVTKNALD